MTVDVERVPGFSANLDLCVSRARFGGTGVDSAIAGKWRGRTGVEGKMTCERDDRSAVSIMVVDRQAVVHAGLRFWLASSEPEIKIVGDFSEPAQFKSAHPAGSPAVDVVLCALEEDGHGPDFDTLGEICRLGHRVIVYSHDVTDEVILTCLDVGALTYVAKSENEYHLREAIYAARSNTPYVGPRMASGAAQRQNRRPTPFEQARERSARSVVSDGEQGVGGPAALHRAVYRAYAPSARSSQIRRCRPARTDQGRADSQGGPGRNLEHRRPVSFRRVTVSLFHPAQVIQASISTARSVAVLNALANL